MYSLWDILNIGYTNWASYECIEFVLFAMEPLKGDMLNGHTTHLLYTLTHTV